MASTSITIKDYRAEIPGALSEDRITWRFPQITSINSHGKQTEWVIYVRLLKGDTEVFATIEDAYFENKPLSGLRGWYKVDSRQMGGVIRESVPTIVKYGKNAGRANATNVLCQALREALGIYNRYLKKAATPPADAATALYPPMLAQLYKKHPPNQQQMNDGVYVQRKYNGLRVVTTAIADRVVMYSRKRLLYPGFMYIRDELAPVLRGSNPRLYLDGEIYKHAVPLQDINSYARREDKPEDVHLEYMIYDCFACGSDCTAQIAGQMPYANRLAILTDIFSKHTFKFCKLVETTKVHAQSQIDASYTQFLQEGFEGAIVRINAPYAFSYNDHHDRTLLKMKPTFDAEFRVIGYTSGKKGKAAAALMFICETKDGVQFNVTPAMELQKRNDLFKKMSTIDENGNTHFKNRYEGQMLVVQYDELSRDKVPQRARTDGTIRTWD